MSAAAVGAIVRAQLDEEAEEPFCAACSELTGGNPLLVRELLAAAARKDWLLAVTACRRCTLIAPAAVGTSVLARLGRLGGEAVALARAVAVLGAGAEVALAARLADLDPVVAELTADRLAAAQILAPVRPLEFFHPLIGAAVREDIAPGALGSRIVALQSSSIREGDGSLGTGRCAPARVRAGRGSLGGRSGCATRRARRSSGVRLRSRQTICVARSRSRLLTGERAMLLLLLGTAEWRAGQPGRDRASRAGARRSRRGSPHADRRQLCCWRLRIT